MNSKFIIVSVLSMFYWVTSQAQEVKVDSNKQKGSTQVIVFSKEAEKPGTGAYKHVTGHDANVVKMGLLDWVSGYVPFYYERRIFSWMSVQAGIGLTTRDFVADVVNLIFSEGVNDYQTNGYASYTYRKSQVGVCASLQPKFYIHNDALDGFSLSPMVAFKRYNYKAQMLDLGQSDAQQQPVYSNVYQNEYRNAIDFTFNLSWQWLYNPLELEFMMGGGFRKFWESRYDIESANGGSNPTIYSSGIRSYSGFRPDFNLSLNFGGFF